MINSTDIIEVNSNTNSINLSGTFAQSDAKVEMLIDLFLSEQQVMGSSRKVYEWSIKRFFQWCRQQRSPSIVTTSDILSYVEMLGKSGYSVKTISSYTVVVRKFFSWLSAKGQYPNIASGIKSPRKQKDTFTKMHLDMKERRDLLNYAMGCSERDYAIINLMLRNGLRTIEVSRLDVCDITTRRGVRIMKLWRKGHLTKDSYVAITEEAYGPIARYLLTRKNILSSSPLFVTDGDGHRNSRLSPRRIQQIVRSGLVAIGLTGKEYSPHSLRHTTAVAILQNGGTIFDVQTVLGHASSSTSQIYTKSIEEDIRLENPPENLIKNAF